MSTYVVVRRHHAQLGVAMTIFIIVAAVCSQTSNAAGDCVDLTTTPAYKHALETEISFLDL